MDSIKENVLSENQITESTSELTAKDQERVESSIKEINLTTAQSTACVKKMNRTMHTSVYSPYLWYCLIEFSFTVVVCVL